jgi:NAD(P) transhydrogenase
VAGAGSDEKDRFDLVVIGSGPAGDKGASQAAYFGYSVAVVERATRVGGGAIAVAGVPVKAMRDTAAYLTGWSQRDVYGVGITLAPDLMMNRLRARITDVVTTMTTAVCDNLARHGVEMVRGDARLGPDRTVIVRDADGDERVLHAGVILVATGSRPFHPPEVPFDDPDVHDSETFLSIERLPARLLVVGGGPVGSEYASIFTGLGVEVTVVDRAPRLLPLLDADLSAEMAAIMERGGARLLLGAEVQSVGRDADGLLVVIDGEPIRPELVLHAVGRAGNVEGLGLEDAGVDADQFGRGGGGGGA